MIDTLKFKIDGYSFDYGYLFEKLEEKCQFERKTTYKYGESHVFKYKNWQFWLSKKSLTASGSLHKLYHGDNLKPFNYSEVKLAIDSLYTLLDFDLSDAKLMQVDLAANLVMQSQVHLYFDLLTCPIGYKPMSVKNETYYFKKNDKAKELVFYDKVKEVKKNNSQLLVKDQNLLRYEIKLKTDIVNIIGDKLLISLYDVDKYAKLVTAWYNTYSQVPKLTKLPLSDVVLTSRKDFTNSLVKKAISSLGGVEVILNKVSKSKVGKTVKYSLRQYLKELKETDYLRPELKEELDFKVHQAYLQHLKTS
ncbi:phage/plasmid replication domain-containing protein [Pedobacter sp. SL55]|uniref:phage/plasmid replication domain-containing protein n=1 Tax=Pedobacter sp. SL55 TaxID=2995161 RepID=UPI0022722369|nr:phage/plasmid replication protein [Pedobacter sp. SL55]WAC39346.1 hypothetical protein OVA16_12095 [Pedobacter sp. SL55]